MAESDLLTGFYFSVRLPGESRGTDAAFQEVSGLSQETTLEEVVSGGENRFKYRLPGPTHYANLVLKRGILMTTSPLIEWFRDTMDGGLNKPVQTKDIMVNLLGSKGQSRMGWTFVKAFPVKWSLSELKSQESNVLIETMELAYQYFQADDPRVDFDPTIANLFGGY